MALDAAARRPGGRAQSIGQGWRLSLSHTVRQVGAGHTPHYCRVSPPAFAAIPAAAVPRPMISMRSGHLGRQHGSRPNTSPATPSVRPAHSAPRLQFGSIFSSSARNGLAVGVAAVFRPHHGTYSLFIRARIPLALMTERAVDETRNSISASRQTGLAPAPSRQHGRMRARTAATAGIGVVHSLRAIGIMVWHGALHDATEAARTWGPTGATAEITEGDLIDELHVGRACRRYWFRASARPLSSSHGSGLPCWCPGHSSTTATHLKDKAAGANPREVLYQDPHRWIVRCAAGFRSHRWLCVGSQQAPLLGIANKPKRRTWSRFCPSMRISLTGASRLGE